MRRTSKEFIEEKMKEVSEHTAKCVSKDIQYPKTKKHWIIESRTMMVQSETNDEKILVVERMKFEKATGQVLRETKKGSIQYRLGYFIVGKNGKKADKWIWGQYNPTIPETDFEKLLELARKEKTIK